MSFGSPPRSRSSSKELAWSVVEAQRELRARGRVFAGDDHRAVHSIEDPRSLINSVAFSTRHLLQVAALHKLAPAMRKEGVAVFEEEVRFALLSAMES